MFQDSFHKNKPEFRYNKTLQAEWVKWLSSDFFSWDWFVTLTFKEDVSLHYAKCCLNKWLLILNKECYGNNFRRYGTEVYYVLAIEKQMRGVYHFHLLIGNIKPSIRRLNYKDVWWDLTLSISRVVAYEKNKADNSEGDAVRYICKYLMKGGELELGGSTTFFASLAL